MAAIRGGVRGRDRPWRTRFRRGVLPTNATPRLGLWKGETCLFRHYDRTHSLISRRRRLPTLRIQARLLGHSVHFLRRIADSVTAFGGNAISRNEGGIPALNCDSLIGMPATSRS